MQNHRTVEVGRDPWRSNPTLRKEAHPKLVAQDHVQTAFEYLGVRQDSQGLSSAKPHSIWLAPACPGTQACSSSGADTSPCWSSWGSCQSLSPACWCSGASGTPCLVSSAHLLKVHSALSSTSLRKMLNRTGPSIGYTTSYWPPTWFRGADHTPLGGAVQAVFSPPRCLLIQPVLHQLLYQHLRGDGVKSLNEVQVENIHCSPLVCQSNDFIVEGFWVWKPCNLKIKTEKMTLSQPIQCSRRLSQ